MCVQPLNVADQKKIYRDKFIPLRITSGCGNSAVLSEDRITHPRITALATGQMQRKIIHFFYWSDRNTSCSRVSISYNP